MMYYYTLPKKRRELGVNYTTVFLNFLWKTGKKEPCKKRKASGASRPLHLTAKPAIYAATATMARVMTSGMCVSSVLQQSTIQPWSVCEQSVKATPLFSKLCKLISDQRVYGNQFLQTAV
jgi:hypothetical protein